MSYGVWRKRGKGWSEIEIDSPHNGPLGSNMREMKNKHQLAHLFRKAILSVEYYDNLDYLKWFANIRIKHPGWVIEKEELGDHTRWTAYDPAILNADLVQ